MGRDGGVMRRLGDPARRQEAGLTLIERLVVIVIFGILAAVVVFAVRGLNDRGERSAETMDERSLRTAQEAHFAPHGSHASEADLVAGGFLRRESVTHDIDLFDSRYEVIPALDRALPLEQQVLTVGALQDNAASNATHRRRFG